MSEHDTLPPDDPNAVDDDPTTPGYTIPSAPPSPTFSSTEERAAALATAPPWALAVVEEMRESREEMAIAMSEFSGAAHGMLQQMRALETNQSSLRKSFDDLRDEMRSRLGAHDTEMGDLRRELSALRKQFEVRFDDLERRAAACEAARGVINGG